MRTLFALVRCYDTMPVDWVSAQACPLDKMNGKESCKAVRLINNVEEMGNSFVGTLLERGIRGRSARPYASGYQRGRSRLEAIIHQRVTAQSCVSARTLPPECLAAGTVVPVPPCPDALPQP